MLSAIVAVVKGALSFNSNNSIYSIWSGLFPTLATYSRNRWCVCV